MGFLKQEWKTLLIALWLIGITIFLVSLNGQLTDLQREGAQLRSTLDTVESVALSTDANIVSIGKKVDGINSNVEFVVTKVRRR